MRMYTLNLISFISFNFTRYCYLSFGIKHVKYILILWELAFILLTSNLNFTNNKNTTISFNCKNIIILTSIVNEEMKHHLKNITNRLRLIKMSKHIGTLKINDSQRNNFKPKGSLKGEVLSVNNVIIVLKIRSTQSNPHFTFQRSHQPQIQ